jgi:hypothetical protein
LPLVVPSGCQLRVGNDQRQVEKGKAWVFDDTIEHEAWNSSSEARVVLIFDIWRPELTGEERDLVAALIEAGIPTSKGRAAGTHDPGARASFAMWRSWVRPHLLHQ